MLTIESNSSLTANSAQFGGGIFNSNYATAMVMDCTLTGNSASSSGGGIYNAATGSGAGPGLTVEADSGLSTISGNSAANGGGIDNAAGATAMVFDTTISMNSATDSGGGIFNAGTLTVESDDASVPMSDPNRTDQAISSAVSGNSADVDGGGIENAAGASAVVSECTISMNSATRSGGGIDNAGNLTVDSSNLSGNSAALGGGAGISTAVR